MSDFLINPYAFATAAPLTATAASAVRTAPAGRSTGNRLFGLIITTGTSTQSTWSTLLHQTISGEELWLYQRTADGTSNDDLATVSGGVSNYYIVATNGGGSTVTVASSFDMDQTAAYSITIPTVTAPGSGVDVIVTGIGASVSPATYGSDPAGYSVLSNSSATGSTMTGQLYTKLISAGATGTSTVTASGGSGTQTLVGTRITIT